MPMPFNLSEELFVWAKEYGDETLSKAEGLYYQIDYKRGKRAKLFVLLLTKLKGLGAEKGYFKAGSVKDAIIRFCLPPKHVLGNKKYANATVCVLKDLEIALIEVYGSESDYYKNNGKVRDSEPTEKSKLEISAEEEHDKPIAESIIKEFEPLPEVLPSEPVKPKRLWKDVKKELIAAGKLTEAPSDYQTDPEIDALFGIKDE